MSDLRNKLIRLAYQKPELRKDLLPLLKTAINKSYRSYEEAMENSEANSQKVLVYYVRGKSHTFEWVDKDVVNSPKTRKSYIQTDKDNKKFITLVKIHSYYPVYRASL